MKVLGFKSTTAEHDPQRGAQEDMLDEVIVMYGDDHDVTEAEKFRSQPTRAPMGKLATRSFGDTAFENIPDKDPGKDKVRFTGIKCGCLEKEGGVSNPI
jgi:hypothetical protein